MGQRSRGGGSHAARADQPCFEDFRARLHPGTQEVKLRIVFSPPGAARDRHGEYQLGFLGFGGHSGFSGTKLLRFGIWIFGKLWASRTSVSVMMPFLYSRNAVTAYTSSGLSDPSLLVGIAPLM